MSMRRGGQRELADDEQTAMQARAVQILHTAVHLAIRIAKDAQLEQFGQKLVALRLSVALLGADKHQQTLINLAGHSVVDHHLRVTNALYQRQHDVAYESVTRANLRLPTCST